MQLILNDIGGGEIVLILIFILIFFGSKSIPGLARTFGRTIRQVREASSEIQNEIRKSGNDMKKDLNLKEMIQETTEDIKRPLDQYASELDDAVKYQPPKRPANKKPLGHELKPVTTSGAPTEKSKEAAKKANKDQPKDQSDTQPPKSEPQKEPKSNPEKGTEQTDE